MRARHRHLNPAHAGATLVLDARYISQSDNTALSPWSDKSASANDATQSTSSKRPSFRTNVTGGQPVVRFSPATNSTTLADAKFLTLGSAISFGENTIFSVHKMTSSRIVVLGGSNTSFSQEFYGSNATNLFIWRNRSDGGLTASNVTAGEFAVFCGVRNSSANVEVFRNGSSAATGSVASTSPQSAFDLVGARGSFGSSDGDIGNIAFFASELAAPLRKKLTHASAYSYKIACN